MAFVFVIIQESHWYVEGIGYSYQVEEQAQGPAEVLAQDLCPGKYQFGQIFLYKCDALQIKQIQRS